MSVQRGQIKDPLVVNRRVMTAALVLSHNTTVLRPETTRACVPYHLALALMAPARTVDRKPSFGGKLLDARVTRSTFTSVARHVLLVFDGFTH